MIHRCEHCNGAIVYTRTANPFEDVWRCEACGRGGNVSWSRAFGPRFEEVKQQQEVCVSKKKPVVVDDPPIDEDAPEIGAAVEYPHCACGSVLALESEQERGVCAVCAPIPVDPAPANESPVAPAVTKPVNVPLPFPPPPCVPFDFHSACADIFAKNRTVQSLERVHLELKERASDAKKQWEAAASAATLAISEYDRKAREADEAEVRQEALQASYREQLDADAARAAQPDLPMEPAEAPTAESRVPDLGTVETPRDYSKTIPVATPLSDALPACACGLVLALDTERAAGECGLCQAAKAI